MSVVFRSNCNWRFTRGRRRSPAKQMPERVHTWEGRYDQLETFLDTYPVGAAHAGGYIIDRDIRDEAPRSEVDLILAFAPDFAAYHAENAVASRTATKSAKVVSDSIIEGAANVDAVRSVSYDAPETTYTYFASALPEGPRFAALAIATAIVIRRSTIVGRGDNGTEKTWSGALAPAPLVAALAMPAAAATTHVSAPIDGTPWYRCTDTVTMELTGDA